MTAARNLRRVVTATALVLVAMFAVVVPSSADHSSDANSGDPDNRDHYIDRNDLSSSGDTAAQWGLWELNQSEMNATFSGSGDVEIYDGYYGDTSWMGRTDCPDGVNWINGNCDVFRVRFNQTNMAGHSLDHWRSLGCHELGHTAGLGHRFDDDDSNDNSCMRSDIWPRFFDTHDLNAINDAV